MAPCPVVGHAEWPSGMTMTSCRKRRICGDGVSDVLANQQHQLTGMVQSVIQRARLFASAMPIRPVGAVRVNPFSRRKPDGPTGRFYDRGTNGEAAVGCMHLALWAELDHWAARATSRTIDTDAMQQRHNVDGEGGGIETLAVYPGRRESHGPAPLMPDPARREDSRPMRRLISPQESELPKTAKAGGCDCLFLIGSIGMVAYKRQKERGNDDPGFSTPRPKMTKMTICPFDRMMHHPVSVSFPSVTTAVGAPSPSHPVPFNPSNPCHRGFALLLPPCKDKRSGAAIYRLALDNFGIIVGKVLWWRREKVGCGIEGGLDERVLEPSPGKEAQNLFSLSPSFQKAWGVGRLFRY
ncbi:uncharacterized protein BO88DRAFT_471143 [Aspergillus vadensis CBS 113365]|uniref:Uncharacterized protein n=1 Tax=Aspergillus vadensis (strain CBS 113365 / IMI 142717 / IBT 24658) TaxID=1448311 RepID=A0A319B001_ASPVC|nr:hypothetical protein BO88DRAFT_471143 [Aspergillus vadensis CBS 113365]PYH65405.1 hypothetical protein BO88DRAFT_471143 [Aspergillus vadensis CBS 113365]